MANIRLYSEHIHSSLYLVTVQNARTGEYEREITDAIPHDLMTVFRDKGQWRYEMVQKIAEYPTIYHNDKLDKLTGQSLIRTKKRNRQHERVYITLCEETTVTCTETGISYTVRLPAADGTNLPTLHPLSQASNCIELLEQCRKHGIYPHARYQRQYLAGMLITLLRSKNLLRCKEPIRANLFLQHCRGNILTSALHYLQNLTSVHGLPGLSLLNVNHLELTVRMKDPNDPNAAKTAAELQLLNWIHDCEIVRTTVRRNEETTRKPVKSIKVYTDKVKQEAKSESVLKATMRKAYQAIKSTYTGNETALIKLDFTIKTVEFLNAAARAKAAQQIKEKWQWNEHAVTIANAILAMDTSATTAELTSLTDEAAEFDKLNGHDNLAGTGKPAKVNFLANIASKIGNVAAGIKET